MRAISSSSLRLHVNRCALLLGDSGTIISLLYLHNLPESGCFFMAPPSCIHVIECNLNPSNDYMVAKRRQRWAGIRARGASNAFVKMRFSFFAAIFCLSLFFFFASACFWFTLFVHNINCLHYLRRMDGITSERRTSQVREENKSRIPEHASRKTAEIVPATRSGRERRKQSAQ